MNDQRPCLSIVAPMYNEEGNVKPFLVAVGQVLSKMNISFEVILVNDGSTDGTWDAIQEAAEADPKIRGVSLSKNFGHQNALFAGLRYACADAIISMDGDLQHPPELIPDLVREWKQGHMIVNTLREDCEDTSAFKRLTSRWFYNIFSRLTGVSMAVGSSDFRLIDAKVLKSLLEMRDADLFLRGLVNWLGYSSTSIPYQAKKRHSGQTKYSLRRMVRFSTGAILSFSMLPLRLGIWIGFIMSLLAVAETCYIIIRYLQGVTVPGWASLMTFLAFMFAVLFILIGIIGTYLGKIYEILKSRPRYIVDHTVGLESFPKNHSCNCR